MKKISCALITSSLRKNQLHEIMRLFQEESLVVSKFITAKIESSRYIIEIISVMNQKLILTKTHFLVQLDSK